MKAIINNYILLLKIINDLIFLLKYILYTYYLVQVKNQAKIKILIDFGNKLNIIIPAYTIKLDFKVCFTNIRAKKLTALFFTYLG